jgi:hypothetical protein
MLIAPCWKSYDVSLSSVALFLFPDALKAVGEVNPKILLQKANGCEHKFRNVEGCRELVAYATKLLGISSVDAVIVQ